MREREITVQKGEHIEKQKKESKKKNFESRQGWVSAAEDEEGRSSETKQGVSLEGSTVV